MKMKKFSLSLASVLAAVALQAQPVITDVTLANDRNRNVVVTYTLAGEEAIVTAAFTSDSAAISDVETSNVRGDVNARVAVGTHQFVWPAREKFPQTVLTNLKVRLTAWSVGQPPDYVAFDLSGKEAPRYYVSSNAVPGGVLARTYKTDKLLMRRIPASGVTAELGDIVGTSTSPAPIVTPMHFVSFSDDYYIGVFTLTAGQYTWITKGAPLTGTDEDAPVKPCVLVIWEDLRGKGFTWPQVADGQTSAHAVAAASPLGKLRAAHGYAFDLPTDAQWEFAARAGQRTDYPGATAAAQLEYGWYADETNVGMEVGLKRPNGFGLYDMGGNVLEFVLDFYGTAAETPAYGSHLTDPVGPTVADENGYRVRRGWSVGQTWDAPFSKSYARVPYGLSGFGAKTDGYRLVCPVRPMAAQEANGND